MNSEIIILHDCDELTTAPDQVDTLEEALQVARALKDLGYKAKLHSFDRDLSFFATVKKETVIFNLVETYLGASFLHLIPLFAQKAGIRFTGGSAHALYLSGDKLLAKQLMKAADIPTAHWLTESNGAEFVGKTVICKPRTEEGSVGISDDSVITLHSLEDIRTLIERAKKEHLLIEEFVGDREFNVSIITKNREPILLPIAEMIYSEYLEEKVKIVGYDAKWDKDCFAYQHTNRSFDVESTLKQTIAAISLKCWSIFGQRGYGRIDLRGDDEGNMWVLEVNINPSINEDSGFIAAAHEAGYTYTEIIDVIIQEAFDE